MASTPASTPARETLDHIHALYPALDGPGLEPLAERVLTVPAGTVLFQEHEPCSGFPLLLEGEVRVSRRSDEGRSLELYRIGPGEVCLASSACLFGGKALSAHGVATRPTRVVMVPAATFRSWLARPAFVDYVMGVYAERMADLAALVDAVAFQRLDQRLAAALLGHGQEIATTHQALADSLGTAREIVTRLLRRFEREGWISVSRERIRILDGAALRRLVPAG